MRERSVVSPDGRRWTVRRVWAATPPWRSPHGGDELLDGWLDFGELGIFGLGYLAITVALLVIAVAIGLVLWLLLPLVVAMLEGAALSLGYLARRRVWAVEAETDGQPPERRRWRVVGLRTSRRALDAVEGMLLSGR